jgi:bacterioferritin (cytochrome b1)
MSFLIQPDDDLGAPRARRTFLGQSGLLLSGAAVALLAGRDALAAGKGGDASNDAPILNTILGSEFEAIAAYQLAVDSGLLQKPVRDLALTFQGQHGQHAARLSEAVTKLGGKPVVSKPHYTFPTETLKNQADILRFAATLEKAAVSAYLGAVPVFANRDLAHLSASILGDEAMHWAVLRNALGEAPVPSAFMS